MWIERFLISAILIVIIQLYVYDKWGLSKIRYKRFFSSPDVFEGEEVKMVEVISNEKILPIPWLRVESKMNKNLRFQRQENLHIDDEEYQQSLFSLMPFMKITRKHKIKCLKRGLYNLNSVALTSGDLFTIGNSNFVYQKVDAKLVVYPKIIPFNEIPIPSRSWQGDITVKRWIVTDPFMILGTREYQMGDSMKDINWKATARTSKVQVHKRDYTANPKLMIYLNVDVKEDQWSAADDTECIELGIRYTASIVQHAISKGIPTGFGTNGYIKDKENEPIRIEPKNSKEQIKYILENLAELVIQRRVTFYTFLEEDLELKPNNRDIIIISTYISKSIEEKIEKLKSKGNSITIIPLL